jgi:hypothetical protein
MPLYPEPHTNDMDSYSMDIYFRIANEALLKCSEENRREILGVIFYRNIVFKHPKYASMYPTFVAQYPQYASKITGMLLEMEVSDLLYLLGCDHELDRKVNEAFQVLIEHLNNAYRNPRGGEPLLD